MRARIIVLGLLMVACLPAHAEVVSGIIYGISSFLGTYGTAVAVVPTIAGAFIRSRRRK